MVHTVIRGLQPSSWSVWGVQLSLGNHLHKVIHVRAFPCYPGSVGSWWCHGLRPFSPRGGCCQHLWRDSSLIWHTPVIDWSRRLTSCLCRLQKQTWAEFCFCHFVSLSLQSLLFGCATHLAGSLLPDQELKPLVVKAWSPNHWTAREFCPIPLKTRMTTSSSQGYFEE